jgi:SAM-dependent methyltransferase
MKYWGKKPHNIWRQFIEHYCPTGGLVVDPFVGSGIAAFEAVKAGRRAVALDLNPLTSFMIEVTASKFEETKFRQYAEQIKTSVEASDVYQQHYVRERGGTVATVLNYRWERDTLVGVAIDVDRDRALVRADDQDVQTAGSMDQLTPSYWYPTERLPEHPSVTHRFIRDLGGDTIDKLWTKRNLALLAMIFDAIGRVSNVDVRLQLASAFTQTLHLCSKMVIPRNTAANREFSGSWGRPDFLIRRRRMEQNPVDVFWRSCVGRQGVIPMMRDAAATLPARLRINDVRQSRGLRQTAHINYGIVDVADLLDFVPERSADFVITDPPYAGLIRYLPLSMVWLTWLRRFDARYAPNLRSEIAVERSSAASRQVYRQRLRNAFENIHRVLKDNGKLVVTFHHQDVREFNDFILAVKGAGFIVDKVTHQYNRRSGESNVANPYGVSASDFYVRCVKRRTIDFTDRQSELERYILDTAIHIVGRRNEPTPYSFLFQSLWPELLQAGFVQPQDSRDEVTRVLNANAGPGRIFKKEPNSDRHVGELWWFNNPAEYISHPDRPLHSRVADSVLAYMRRHTVAKLDDVIAGLFREYPNGLTPDPRTIGSVLEGCAYRAQGKWRIKPEFVVAATQHSEAISTILDIGGRLGLRRFVGRREQPEYTSRNVQLRTLADITSLRDADLELPEASLERLEMVDVVFVTPNIHELICLWEVENSTDFTSAIQRGSNAPNEVPKIMVIPDQREAELLRIVDPLFRQAFSEHGWRYMTYTDLSRAVRFATRSLADVTSTAKPLPGE